MMKRLTIFALISGALALGQAAPIAREKLSDDYWLQSLTHGWRDDPVWADGLAEIAVYQATRNIYSTPRSYEARFITNTEYASPETFTKSDDAAGRAVFKFHVREDIPTDKYGYHYSTMCYVGTDDLKSLKLDMGSQEDCGATFKQFINHAGKMWWKQLSYFPGEGERTGEVEPPANLVFFDALPLVLRGYPFDEPRPGNITLKVLPDQTTNRFGPTRLEDWVVVYVGREDVELTSGPTEAHLLELRFAGPTREARPPIRMWFAADPDRLHIMVKYEGPGGQTYELDSVRREAYWR